LDTRVVKDTFVFGIVNQGTPKRFDSQHLSGGYAGKYKGFGRTFQLDDGGRIDLVGVLPDLYLGRESVRQQEKREEE
jgi:hypothetical protein